MKRVAQPPINPATRSAEAHDFWPGFIFTIIALLILYCGVRHITAVETVDGNNAFEWQLVKSFSSGGLEYVVPSDAPQRADPNDPAAAAREQERRERASAAHPKYRVNTGASTPCPT
jgi:hypothetical protein